MADIYSRLMDGLQLAQEGAQRKRQSRLAQLASQAYGADPEAQRGYVQQAIGLDPQAGFQIGQSLGNDRDSLQARLAQEAGIFSEAPDDQKAAMYPQLAAHAKRLGFPVPDTYDPRMLPMIQKIAMAGVGTSQTVQSTYIDAQGNRVAILRNGQTQVLGQNAPNNQIIDTGNGFYGVNKGNLQAAPVMIGGPQAQQEPSGYVNTPSGPVNIDPNLPPEIRAQIAANPDQFTQGGTVQGAPIVQDGPAPQQQPMPQQAPAPQGGALPPALDYQNGGQLRSVPKPISPAEQQRLVLAEQASKRADDAAQRAAQVAQRGTAPAGYRFRADGSLEPIPGAPASTGAETQKQAVYAKNMAQDALAFASAFTGIPLAQLQGMTPEQVRTAMMEHDRATAGPVMGSLPLMGKLANPDLEAYSNSAAGKQARINNPTGPVTNADFEVARKSVFSADKPRKVNADLVYEALLRAQGAANPTPQSNAGPQPGTVEDGYRFKGGNPADPNSWEKI